MYHDDLIEQARTMATHDARRPRQANLRRAVSTAYYAVFHFLVDQACRSVLGTQQGQAAYRRLLGRAFDHSAMKGACRSFGGGTLPDSIQRALPANFRIARETKRVAGTFVELQEARHRADYDLTQPFTRSEALTMISEVEKDIRGFDRLNSSVSKKFFLACLLAWKPLETRR